MTLDHPIPKSKADPTLGKETPKGTPIGIIRKPLQEPPMVNIRGDRPEFADA